MRKVMLVVDEYQELVTLENLLRRLGFDVLSVGKELLVADALLRFTPDIVLMHAKSRMVDGPRLAARLRKVSPPPKIVFLFPANISRETMTPEVQALVDAALTLPAQAKSVIKAVAELTGLDSVGLIEKYARLTSPRSPDAESDGVRGSLPAPEQSIKVSGKISGSPTPERQTEKLSEKSGDKQAEKKVHPPDPWPNETEDFDPLVTRGQAATLRSARSDRYDRFLEHNAEPIDKTISREALTAASNKLKADSESEAENLERIDREKREFVRVLFDPKNRPKRSR